MKIYMFAAAITLLLMAGCGKAIYPSGAIVSETRCISGFDSISTADGIKVEINRTSGKENVEIKGDDNIIGYIETFVSDGTLTIQVRDGIVIGRKSSVAVTVNTSSVSALSASGGASISCNDPVHSESLAISLSGGARLTGIFDATAANISLSGGARAEGAFRTGSMVLSLSGGSKTSFRGTAERLTAACSGGSSAEGFGLSAESASLELSGGSTAKFTITRDIAINASGGSKLIYNGAAVVSSRSLTGGSKILKQ